MDGVVCSEDEASLCTGGNAGEGRVEDLGTVASAVRSSEAKW